MDPEKDEQKQDDQELKGLGNILKTGAKKAKNVFSMIFRKIIAAIRYTSFNKANGYNDNNCRNN